jgi:hypothetical protein
VAARQLAGPAGLPPCAQTCRSTSRPGRWTRSTGQLAQVTALLDRYTAAGLTDVTLKTYPQARHEIFNETNRDEVVADLITWLDGKLLTRSAAS